MAQGLGTPGLRCFLHASYDVTRSPSSLPHHPYSLERPCNLCSSLLRSTGSPTPTIHWSKLRSPLPWQHQLEGDTLIIPRVAQQDSGQYICNATSPAGYTEATIVLHVESKAPMLSLWSTLSILCGGLSPPTRVYPGQNPRNPT